MRNQLLAFIINAILAFALSIIGYWELLFIPAALLGFLLHLRPRSSLWITGLSGALGVLISILILPYALQNGAITALIIGLPGGAVIPLLITLLLALLDSGIGGALGAIIARLAIS
ncbi:MAG: hypothetical protein ACP5NY_00965 [Thermocladium sp.]